MTIRPYRDSDLRDLVALFTRSVHTLAAPHYNEAQRHAWASHQPDPVAWRDRLALLQTLVAESGSRLAGFIAFSPSGYIDLLYTSPTSARQGAATTLLRHASALLSESGVTNLSTHASLVARPFFEHHGFQVTETQHIERNGQTFQRFAMSKTLAPPPAPAPPPG